MRRNRRHQPALRIASSLSPFSGCDQNGAWKAVCVTLFYSLSLKEIANVFLGNKGKITGISSITVHACDIRDTKAAPVP